MEGSRSFTPSRMYTLGGYASPPHHDATEHLMSCSRAACAVHMSSDTLFKGSSIDCY